MQQEKKTVIPFSKEYEEEQRKKKNPIPINDDINSPPKPVTSKIRGNIALVSEIQLSKEDFDAHDVKVSRHSLLLLYFL